GAFTGAERDHKGLFRAAQAGTLFLDEIGDMSLSLQAKLLRVLQERRVRPVGETRDLPVDTRVVAATHRDLEELVHAGRFREDLYYRLKVVTVEVPPLRERRDDVVALALHFLEQGRRRDGKRPPQLAKGAMSALQAYDWPGNVRELENVLTRAV